MSNEPLAPAAAASDMVVRYRTKAHALAMAFYRLSDHDPNTVAADYWHAVITAIIDLKETIQ